VPGWGRYGAFTIIINISAQVIDIKIQKKINNLMYAKTIRVLW
jgi:hypothetical protein